MARGLAARSVLRALSYEYERAFISVVSQPSLGSKILLSQPSYSSTFRSFTSTPFSLANYMDNDSYLIPPPTNIGILIVPEKAAYVIERFGKYHGTLGSGLHFLVPFVRIFCFERVAQRWIASLSLSSSLSSSSYIAGGQDCIRPLFEGDGNTHISPDGNHTGQCYHLH
jgi:hypothetical protein